MSDLTEIPTGEGTLYLASILDLHSRRCVGFALGVHHDADLAAAALCVAIAVRGGDVAGVVFHTDQGGEYTGGELTRACARAGIVQSMGRTGSALDNAVAEAFHSTLEFELLSRQVFATQPDARRAVVAWLEEYNTVRLHSTNGLISPVDYEHGRRRPGAKPYDRLRRRRHRQRRPVGEQEQDNPAEAAPPPVTPVEPLRDGHRRRAASGPAPPASRAADAVADATALRAALDPGASTGPGRQPQRQATACRRTPRAATRPRSLRAENYKITLTGVSTVSGDCQKTGTCGQHARETRRCGQPAEPPGSAPPSTAGSPTSRISCSAGGTAGHSSSSRRSEPVPGPPFGAPGERLSHPQSTAAIPISNVEDAPRPTQWRC